jgi:hypothetical protein
VKAVTQSNFTAIFSKFGRETAKLMKEIGRCAPETLAHGKLVAPFAAWLCACVAAKRRNTRRDSTHH